MTTTAKTDELKDVTLVCLVSDQPMPNLLSILLLKPRRVVLVATGEMIEQADRLKSVALHNLPRCCVQIAPLASAYDSDIIAEAMMKVLIDAQAQPDAGEIILNATGGTKMMVLASASVFAADDKQILYVSEATDELIYLPRTNASEPLSRRTVRIPIRLLDYLKVHGYTAERSRSADLPLSEQFFEHLILGQQKFSAALAGVNALAQKALENSKSGKAMTALIENAANSDLQQLLSIFQEEKLLGIKNNVVEFPSERARFAVNGGWFEDFAYKSINELRSHGVSSVEKNLKIASGEKQIGQGADNEIDVCFMHRNSIYIVECKTCAMNETKVTTPIINKLIAIKQKMGNKARLVLLSYQRVANKSARARAQENGICLIDGNSVCQLKKNLLAILDKESLK